jgi:hypothetical protein
MASVQPDFETVLSWLVELGRRQDATNVCSLPLAAEYLALKLREERPRFEARNHRSEARQIASEWMNV